MASQVTAWQLEATQNTVQSNGAIQVYYHGDADHPTRWLKMLSNNITSTFFPDPWPLVVGNVIVTDLVGTPEATCWGDTELCDFRFENNVVSAHDNQPEINLVNSYWAPSTVLRFNSMSQYDSFVDVLTGDTFSNDPRCWTKGNTCNDGGSTPWGGCSAWRARPFYTAPCWY